MKQIQFKIKAISPIHVGSDTVGTLRMPYLLHLPHNKESFIIDKLKLQRFIIIIGMFYKMCDKNNFGKRTFGEAFKDRIYSSLCTNTVSQFFTNLFNKLPMDNGQLYEYLTNFVCSLTDKEHRYLLQWSRENIDIFVTAAIYNVENYKLIDGFTLNESLCEIESDSLVPVIPGNSFRGRMRRLLMNYVIDYIYGDNAQKVLNAKSYHTLFSGGMLTSQTGFINRDDKQVLRETLPFLSILGCMKGNEDLPGKIKVHFGKLDCAEFNIQNKRNGLSYLKEYFLTRKDDYEKIKTEEEIKEFGSSVQMYYSVMAIETNSELNWEITYDNLDEMEKQFFDLMVALFIKDGFIGGLNRAGYGKIRIQILDDYILDFSKIDHFLNENREKIKKAIENL